MRAIVIEDYGTAPALADIPAPSAGPGEIRVKVRNSSLNGFDIAMARGYLRGLMDHAFPATLGRDFAGTVDQVGEGVSLYAEGDDVFGVVLTQPLHHGGFAEYLVVPEDHNVTRMPETLGHHHAGVLGLAGSAALAALDAVGVRAGEPLLITGATGGVGAVAIQLAGAAGVVVIATARPGQETDHVLGLGADHVVDFTDDIAGQVRALAPEGVAAALHFAGDADQLGTLLAPGGRYASLLSALPSQSGSITAVPVVAMPHRANLDRLARLVVSGDLRLPVQRTYSLDAVPKAVDDFAAGTVGKLAVVID
jgi:NADPH:quinone reductase-like Zn-dependent oxidoreductase